MEPRRGWQEHGCCKRRGALQRSPPPRLQRPTHSPKREDGGGEGDRPAGRQAGGGGRNGWPRSEAERQKSWAGGAALKATERTEAAQEAPRPHTQGGRSAQGKRRRVDAQGRGGSRAPLDGRARRPLASRPPSSFSPLPPGPIKFLKGRRNAGGFQVAYCEHWHLA